METEPYFPKNFQLITFIIIDLSLFYVPIICSSVAQPYDSPGA